METGKMGGEASGEIPAKTNESLAKANEALADLRAGRFEGAAVLVPSDGSASASSSGD